MTDAEKVKLLEEGTLTLRDAAKHVGISKASIYTLMNAGRLPWVKLGRRRLIPRRAISSVLVSGLIDADLVPTV